MLSLFRPETVGIAALAVLRSLNSLTLGSSYLRLRYCKKVDKRMETELFGLTFSHPIGLAAGIDNCGKYCGCLSNLGFSFIEIGSITAEAEKGFKKPRIIRLSSEKSFIHSTGVPNPGVRKVIAEIQENRRKGSIIAINIASSPYDTKDSQIIEDFRNSFSLAYDFADMFTINLSAPNENGVFTVQDCASLAEIADPLLELRACYGVYKPILIKVSTDIQKEQLDSIIDWCRISGIDGIIAGNSPKAKDSHATNKLIGGGCLSGALTYESSLKLVKYIHEYTDGRFPIIACGGIMTATQAREMLQAGASLIQIHSGLIYHGPSIVRKILKQLEK